MQNQKCNLDSLSEDLKKRALRSPLPLAAFMAEAVEYYYATRDPLGREGDFTTAPEISQMFGEIIGAGLLHFWQGMGSPKDFALLELGPGRGTLMSDILRVMKSLASPEVLLLETSPVLKAAQAGKLAEHHPSWLSGLDKLPPKPLLIVANEFFDALPIHQFEMADGRWHERAVVWNESQSFYPVLIPTLDMFAHHLKESLPEAGDGDVFELCPAGLSIMAGLAGHLSRHGGYALIIDYGHVKSGLGDTLQAVRNHRFVSPYADPGNSDITAHVDFGALYTVAEKEGCRIAGLLTQGALLKKWGIDLRAQKLLETATEKQANDIRSALKRLTDDGEMGALFKALIVTGWEK